MDRPQTRQDMVERERAERGGGKGKEGKETAGAKRVTRRSGGSRVRHGSDGSGGRGRHDRAPKAVCVR